MTTGRRREASTRLGGRAAVTFCGTWRTLDGLRGVSGGGVAAGEREVCMWMHGGEKSGGGGG